MDLPKVRIGGEDFVLPAIMNFAALERAWPTLQAYDRAGDQISRVSAGLAFIVQVLLPSRPEITLPWLKDRLRVKRFDPDTGALDPEGDEQPGVLRAVALLCVASGLVAREGPEGEADAPGESPGQSLSTAILHT